MRVKWLVASSYIYDRAVGGVATIIGIGFVINKKNS